MCRVIKKTFNEVKCTHKQNTYQDTRKLEYMAQKIINRLLSKSLSQLNRLK